MTRGKRLGNFTPSAAARGRRPSLPALPDSFRLIGLAAGRMQPLQRRRRLARFIERLLDNPEAAGFWAKHCGWVPGSGRCRTGLGVKCRPGCPFTALREKEADRLRRLRRLRRPAPRVRG